jgi:alpha-mannosidase
VYKGELTGNIHHLNVRSVYSTRIYLKQNNFQCQSLLEKYVEPISAISFIEGLNDFKPNIDYSWKTLLKNHPHDSITGCSIDEVHRDMMNRFNRIQQIGKYIEEKSISAISNEINTEVHEGEPIVVYNPLNWQRQEVIRGKILFPDSSLVYKIKQEKNNISFNLLNFIGETVPFQIINKYEKNIIELNNWRKFLIYEIEFVASVPPMGYSIFYFQETNVNPSKSKIKISKNSIENEFYKITVNKNGSLRILNKLTKESFNNFNMFEDTEDDGDEYTYSFVENSKTFTTSDSVSRVDLFEKNLLSGTLRVEINFRLPESLDESRTKRSKKITNNKIVSYITLYSNVNRVDIKTEVDNNSKDHRLRILFPTKFKDYRNYADGHFDVVERVKYFPDKPKERGKIEYYSTQHQSNFVTLTNGKTGITIANKGLPEYEIKKEESAIALTLLRSMGWLNKNNLMTRWRMAGPDIETPDAQCQGKNVFEYSIIIHKDSWENAYKEAYNFVYSLYSISIKRNFGTLPGSLSFITLKPDDLIISALKITEKKDGLLLRFYNIKSYDVPGEIIIYKDFKKCFLTDFLENELSELKIVDNRVKISVSRNKIINLKLIFN